MNVNKRILAFIFLLALPPVMASAQTCKPESILASTPTSSFTDHVNGTVTDNRTGLMWKKCSEGQTWNSANNSCSGEAATYTWKAALEQAIAVNARSGAEGVDGWRVPNIKELISIIEVQCHSPKINLNVFVNTPTWIFWSSSPFSGYSGSAWIVDFGDNDAGSHQQKGDVRHVRLVRDDRCTIELPDGRVVPC